MNVRKNHVTLLLPSRSQVCKDVRSDVESSSEEEEKEEKEGGEQGGGPRAPTEIHGTFSHAPKGENGTNGHCAAVAVTAARARPHNHHSGC